MKLIFALLVFLPSFCFGQGRVDDIMRVVEDRASRQEDYWFKTGDWPRLIQLLRVRALLFPTDYEINTNLGWMLGNIGLKDEELAVYVRFRLRNAGNPDAPFPEANLYYMAKAYAKVPPLLEPTIPAKPHPNSYRILAHSYERMGLYADSVRVWDKLIERQPDDGAAKNNRARAEKKRLAGEKPAVPKPRR